MSSSIAMRLAALSLVILIAQPSLGVEVIRVEEEWSLEVGEPSLTSNAPQVSMVMSPTSNLEAEFFMFVVNHRLTPSYAAGGCQIQVWDRDSLTDYRTASNTASLESTSETVTWKQVLSVEDGSVTFEIENGKSTTWGDFGGAELTQSVGAGVSNLNGYRPNVSLRQSGIGYAGNRVVGLTLLRIKWVLSNGQTYELNAPLNIDSDLNPWDD